MPYSAMEIHFSRYALMQNLQTSRVTIYSLVTEEIKDFSAGTLASVEEKNRFYIQKMYVNATPWPAGCACKPVILLDFALGASEVTLNTALSSH